MVILKTILIPGQRTEYVSFKTIILDVNSVQYFCLPLLLHVLGMWHEQSRYNRDQYVRILWQNIAQGKEDQFGRFGILMFLLDSLLQVSGLCLPPL